MRRALVDGLEHGPTGGPQGRIGDDAVAGVVIHAGDDLDLRPSGNNTPPTMSSCHNAIGKRVRPRPVVEAELTVCPAVQGDTRRRLAITGGAVGLALVVGAAIFAMSSDDESPDGAALTTPTTQRAPGATAAPTTPTTAPDLPTPTVPPPPPPIPGLRASDIQAALTADGFQCNPSPDFQSEDHLIIDCAMPGGLASVRTYATMADELVAMQGYTFTVSDHRWLTFLATRPWDGSDPAGAQAWVEQTLQAGGVIGARNEQIIGGVPCTLIASGGDLWQIEIGEPPYTT